MDALKQQMNTEPKRQLVSDEAVSSLEHDRLDFVHRYAVPLARRIVSEDLNGPLTLGIYGPWGSGKTSLMNLLRRLVSGEDKIDEFVLTQPCLPIQFTAWKYSQEQSLWRALVKTILDGILKKGGKFDPEIQAIRESLYGDVVRKERKLRVNWPRLAGALSTLVALLISVYLKSNNVASPTTVDVALGGFVLLGSAVAVFGVSWAQKKGEDDKKSDLTEKLGAQAKGIAEAFEVVDDVLTTHKRVEYIEQFAENFELIVERYLDKRRLVVFIDDLDRCLPEKAVQVLEGIKLFLGVKNTVFVVGVDVPVLARGIEIHYAQQGFQETRTNGQSPMVNGMRYLEKVVQFPFHIPPLAIEEIVLSPLTQTLSETNEDRAWLEIGINGFNGNPRAIIRFARIYRHRREVIKSSNPALLEGRELHLAKLIVLQEHNRWTQLIDLIISYTVSTPIELLKAGPLAILERAATNPKEYDDLHNKPPSGGIAALKDLSKDDELMRFLKAEPRFDFDPPIDPLPLIRLGGGRTAEASRRPAQLGLSQIVERLTSSDDLAQTDAFSLVREMKPQGRREVVEQLLAQVAGWAESENPDATRLPRAVSSLESLYDMGIETELLEDRAEWCEKLVARLSTSTGNTKESHQALLKLISKISHSHDAETKDVGFVPDDQTQEDSLGLNRFAIALDKSIQGARTPLTVGVFGSWGSGKTSLLYMIRKQLHSRDNFRTTFINAWQDFTARPSDVFLTALSETFPEKREQFNQLRESSSAGKETDRRQLRNGLQHLLAGKIDDSQRLAIFVDDLDRCLPEFQIEFLEIAKFALSIEGVITVIAVDREQIQNAVKARFNNEPVADNYLEKLIDLSFEIPSLKSSDLEAYAAALLGGGKLAEAVKSIQRFLDPNPRMIKSYVNSLFVYLEIAHNSNREPDINLMARLVLIKWRWPKLLESPAVLLDLWRATVSNDLETRYEIVGKLQSDGQILDVDDLISFLKEYDIENDDEFYAAISLIQN